MKNEVYGESRYQQAIIDAETCDDLDNLANNWFDRNRGVDVQQIVGYVANGRFYEIILYWEVV